MWTLSSAALLCGCVKASGDFCAVARPMYFDAPSVVDWLADNDVELLRAIVSHNEKAATCR